MALSKKFIDAVSEKDTSAIKNMILDSILIDNNADEVAEMLSYLDQSNVDVFVRPNKEILKYNPSEWDETYLNEQIAALSLNFSRERVELLKEMLKKLYPKKINRKIYPDPYSYQSNDNSFHGSKDKSYSNSMHDKNNGANNECISWKTEIKDFIDTVEESFHKPITKLNIIKSLLLFAVTTIKELLLIGLLEHLSPRERQNCGDYIKEKAIELYNLGKKIKGEH